MYTAIVLLLCYVPMVTSMYAINVINYRHCIVQVAIYSIPYLFHHGCITNVFASIIVVGPSCSDCQRILPELITVYVYIYIYIYILTNDAWYYGIGQGIIFNMHGFSFIVCLCVFVCVCVCVRVCVHVCMCVTVGT